MRWKSLMSNRRGEKRMCRKAHVSLSSPSLFVRHVLKHLMKILRIICEQKAPTVITSGILQPARASNLFFFSLYFYLFLDFFGQGICILLVRAQCGNLSSSVEKQELANTQQEQLQEEFAVICGIYLRVFVSVHYLSMKLDYPQRFALVGTRTRTWTQFPVPLLRSPLCQSITIHSVNS